MLSIDDEVAFIWSPQDRRVCATIVYVLSRYGTILQYTLPTIPLENLSAVVRISRYMIM